MYVSRVSFRVRRLESFCFSMEFVESGSEAGTLSEQSTLLHLLHAQFVTSDGRLPHRSFIGGEDGSSGQPRLPAGRVMAMTTSPLRRSPASAISKTLIS